MSLSQTVCCFWVGGVWLWTESELELSPSLRIGPMWAGQAGPKNGVQPLWGVFSSSLQRVMENTCCVRAG